ncbi:MAG: CoA transferase [Thermodesulfobacteriota bacterium]
MQASAPRPFDGILVLDLTRVLAGPFCTLLLAELGARVVKVEHPRGDPARGFGPFLDGRSLYFEFINRGKESIALDLKDESDRALLLRLARRADVLVENFRPGAMERLGLGWDALAAANPRLVYASASGFGQTGPWSRLPAYDTVIQAMSGLMSETGFADGPPTRVGASIADLTTGVYAVAAIATALYARERTGRGARIDVAMLDAMLSYLEHGFMHLAAFGRAPGRIGNRHPSITPFDTFATADAEIVVCAGEDGLFRKLCAALGRDDVAADPRFAGNAERTGNEAVLKAELERTLRTRGAAEWLALLTGAGIPCAPINDVVTIAASPQVAARNMLVDVGGLRMPGNPIKIAGYADPTTRPPAPRLDEHGAAIRRELA